MDMVNDMLCVLRLSITSARGVVLRVARSPLPVFMLTVQLGMADGGLIERRCVGSLSPSQT